MPIGNSAPNPTPASPPAPGPSGLVAPRTFRPRDGFDGARLRRVPDEVLAAARVDAWVYNAVNAIRNGAGYLETLERLVVVLSERALELEARLAEVRTVEASPVVFTPEEVSG